MTPPSKITVSIVEDNAALGASLHQVVETSTNLRMVGLWSTGGEALEKIVEFRPQVILMGIDLPDISGIEVTARIKRHLPEIEIIMVTDYRDHNKIFAALRAGASGYLHKRSSTAEVCAAITEVLQSAETSRRVVETFHRPQPQARGTLHLTKREADVLDLLAEGLGNKEIAARLGLSIDTVRAYLRTSYEKLHVHTRTEAAVKYLSGNPRSAS